MSPRNSEQVTRHSTGVWAGWVEGMKNDGEVGRVGKRERSGRENMSHRICYYPAMGQKKSCNLQQLLSEGKSQS